jgi:hypothetical protein
MGTMVAGNPANDLVAVINSKSKLPALRNSAGLGCMALQYIWECMDNTVEYCKPPEAHITANCGAGWSSPQWMSSPATSLPAIDALLTDSDGKSGAAFGRGPFFLNVISGHCLPSMRCSPTAAARSTPRWAPRLGVVHSSCEVILYVELEEYLILKSDSLKELRTEQK